MSFSPLQCSGCGTARVFDRAGKFPEDGGETTFAVGWRCTRCSELALDLCPTGPVEPAKGSCLNCGGELAGAASCTGCGVGRDEALPILGVADRSELKLEVALSAFGEGLYRRGLLILNILLQEQETRGELWKEKAKVLQSLRLNGAAVRCYRRALALQPDPFVSIALACGLQDLGEHAAAAQTYDAVIRDSDDADALAIAHANRGNARSALGETDTAAADYEEAIRREPKRVSHRLNHARHHARRKQWEDAVRVAQSGLLVTSGEDSVPLLLEMANALNEQEKADDGLKAAEAVLVLVPDQPRALYARGWALGMLGRLEEAAASMKRLLELDPGNKAAQNALAKLEAALPGQRRSRPWWKTLWS